MLAVLLTDAASFARVDLVDLATGKPKSTIGIGDPQRLFERVVVADGNAGVVLISRDAGTGRRSAQYYDAEGKAAGHPGPGRRDRGGAREGRPARAGRAHPRQRPRRRHVQGQPPRRARPGCVWASQNSFTLTKGGDLRPPAAEAGRLAEGLQRDRRPGTGQLRQGPRLPAARSRGHPRHPVGRDHLARRGRRRGRLGRGHAAAQEVAGARPVRRVLARHADLRPGRLPGPARAPSSCRCRCATTIPARCRSRRTSPAASLLFSLAIDPLHAEALARRKKDHVVPRSLLGAAGGGPRRQRPTGKAPLDVDHRASAARAHGRSARHLGGRRWPRRRSAQAQELQPRRQSSRGLPARTSSRPSCERAVNGTATAAWSRRVRSCTDRRRSEQSGSKAQSAPCSRRKRARNPDAHGVVSAALTLR